MRTIYALVAAVLVLGLGATAARAQKVSVDYDLAGNRVSVDAENAPLTSVVNTLFARAGGGVTPQFELGGKNPPVTLHLRGLTPEQALQRIVDAAGARYRNQGRVYTIYIEALPDVEDVPAVFRGRIDVNAKDRPIGEVTRVMAEKAHIRILYDPTVPGDLRVTCVARNEPLWTVLQRIAIAARLKVSVMAPRELILRPLSSVDVRRGGERVGSVREEYGACRSCSFHELRSEWRFCPMCGARINR